MVQLVNKYFKRCFSCNRLKPLILFKTNNRIYQLKSDKGKVVDCRLCTIKRFINQKGTYLQFNTTINKYDTIIEIVSLKAIIKNYLK